MADVPIEYVHEAVLVEAMVNNQGPYTFLVDTGSTACAVTPELAQWLKLPKSGSGLVTAMGSAKQASFVNIGRMSIGAATARNLKAVLWTGSSLSEIAGRRVDGIIGTPFLWKWPVQIDYPHSRIRFFPETYDVTAEPNMAPWSGATPMRIKGRAAYVQAALNGTPVRWLMLDTGANALVITEDTAAKVNARVSPLESVSYSAFGDRRSSRVWLLDSLRIAGLSVENPQAFSPTPWGDWPSEQLGNDALDECRVTIDATRKVMRVERDRIQDRFAASPWGVGLTVKRGSDDTIRVAEVWPDGPAAVAGITSGDEIIAVGNTPADIIADLSLKSLFSQPPGTTVSVKVRTPGNDAAVKQLVSKRYVRLRSAPANDSIATTLSVPHAPGTKSDW